LQGVSRGGTTEGEVTWRAGVISKTKIMVYGVAITEFFPAILLLLLLASAFRQCLGFILKEKLMMQLLSL